MLSIPITKTVRFEPRWLPSFAMGFILCVLIVLGHWQLHRYEDKKTLLHHYQSALQAIPHTLVHLISSQQDIRFQPVQVVGHYLNDETLLLPNRFYRHRLGFEVFTPLQLTKGNKILLIDRGWVAADHQKIPVFKPIHGQERLSGYIDIVQPSFILGKNILDPLQRPLIIQRIDFHELNQLWQQSFYPFIIRLSPRAAHGFVRHWIVLNTPPERHLGYAIQWFALTFALLIAYFCFSCRQTRSNDS
ncbi:MAG: hypothetical protein A3F41_01365 [Coxiella sp. RIFCSPHIGHO2_12_FULL_44_14]|nr:MAG: hypothetical protein A3F41_01365 [Coxiella sp. RIFCSPHIGHO2_12_FULL_44_14]